MPTPKMKHRVSLLCMALSLILLLPIRVYASSSPLLLTKEQQHTQDTLNLYAKSAVLMDADSGRILYEKNGFQIMPMASTTKIMTCIVALENIKPDEYAVVSSYASSMPKVHLGAKAGEYFKIEDLLYSLMLESHNDSAVIIAEKVAGSTEAFATLMNKKAKEIGCSNTCFITPNGLDAVATSLDHQTKIHSTTAADLARIMSYCIMESPKKEEFLKITRTPSYAFTSYLQENQNYSPTGKSYHCNNHNAFLNMMDGALSGKTGFTGNAGYCYVGALRQGERTFVVALLACGWPNHKTYKWSDTKQLMNYGLSHYETHTLEEVLYSEEQLPQIPITNSQTPLLGDIAYETPYILRDESAIQKRILLSREERFDVKVSFEKTLTAPVFADQKIGEIQYSLNGIPYYTESIHIPSSLKQIDFTYCLRQILCHFLGQKMDV